jgi:hypothetical protein
MSGNIYLIRGERQLIAMSECPYESESLLQQLLAEHPSLLAGEQMINGSPRRWLLVSREVAVAPEQGASWYVDHLYIDQDGIPTLVEVKRSTDTRIRREVVGQMLDYAAHAGSCWSSEHLRVRIDSEPDGRERFHAFLGERDPNEFWSSVDVNLASGRIRMVFVADVIPAELRTIVNFLAAQMRYAEIFAVEVRNYQALEERALVPRLVSTPRTVAPEVAERRWDEHSFFEELARRRPEQVQIARTIHTWARRNMSDFWYGTGATAGSCYPRLFLPDGRLLLFSMWTNGTIQMQFQHMRIGALRDENKRRELAARLNDIPGIAISTDAVRRRPSFDMSMLADERSQLQFLDAMQWAIDSVQCATPV